jgi:hypothetical protein
MITPAGTLLKIDTGKVSHFTGLGLPPERVQAAGSARFSRNVNFHGHKKGVRTLLAISEKKGS